MYSGAFMISNRIEFKEAILSSFESMEMIKRTHKLNTEDIYFVISLILVNESIKRYCKSHGIDKTQYIRVLKSIMRHHIEPNDANMEKSEKISKISDIDIDISSDFSIVPIIGKFPDLIKKEKA